jgi:hypothetical protein
MKNVITKLFLFAVGLLLSFNYVIFPGLTAVNTFYNIGAVLVFIGFIYMCVVHYLLAMEMRDTIKLLPPDVELVDITT